MTQAKNDRNTVTFGPSRTPVSYKLDRVEEEVKDLERKVENGDIGGGGGFELGEIADGGNSIIIDGVTYPIDGNWSGFSPGDGDIVTIIVVDGERYVVTIVQHTGGYIPIDFQNPQANNDFPYDGDALPTEHNPHWSASSTSFATAEITQICGFYAEAVLGYAGRIVVMLGNDAATAQPPITIYDVETGGVTDINRTAAVGATNRTRGLGVVGTRLFVTYDGTTGNCVESWNSTTGVWSTHAISHAVFAGVSDDRAWWVGYSSGGSRFRVHSIDESGTLSSIDYPTNITFTSGIASTSSSYVFAKAKAGKIWVDIDTTSAAQVMAVADTNVAAASLTFTTFATPNDLPWSRIGNGAGNTNYVEMGKAETLSDIASNGDLYYLTQTGTPTTWGFAVVDAVTYTVTRYGTITSATGNVADGEVSCVGGMALAGAEVILFGAIREDVADPVTGRTTAQIPAFWRTDGVTTILNFDADYIGLTGPSPAYTAYATSGARVIPRYDISSTFVFLKNHGEYAFGVGTPYPGRPVDAESTGPSFIDALTV